MNKTNIAIIREPPDNEYSNFVSFFTNEYANKLRIYKKMMMGLIKQYFNVVKKYMIKLATEGLNMKPMV